MDKKICTYICTGCGIGEAINIEELSGVVTGEMSQECKTHAQLCGPEGRAFLENEKSAEGINTFNICACSPARKSVVQGTSVGYSVEIGGGRIIEKKKKEKEECHERSTTID